MKNVPMFCNETESLLVRSINDSSTRKAAVGTVVVGTGICTTCLGNGLLTPTPLDEILEGMWSIRHDEQVAFVDNVIIVIILVVLVLVP